MYECVCVKALPKHVVHRILCAGISRFPGKVPIFQEFWRFKCTTDVKAIVFCTWATAWLEETLRLPKEFLWRKPLHCRSNVTVWVFKTGPMMVTWGLCYFYSCSCVYVSIASGQHLPSQVSALNFSSPLRTIALGKGIRWAEIAPEAHLTPGAGERHDWCLCGCPERSPGKCLGLTWVFSAWGRDFLWSSHMTTRL
jgi:hypothetical protein